jgi:AcrR family transcriptional regulator
MRADAARNRQALMDAAQRLYTTRGLSVTLDDIAAEAGVNVATAYRNFANKGELVQAFLQGISDEAIAIAEAAAAVEDPWQGLTDFFAGTLRLMAENRGMHEVVTASYLADWMQHLEDRVNPALATLLSRARKAGVIRPGLEPADLGVVLQMLATVTDIETPDVRALVRRYLTLVLDGLRASDKKLPGTAPTSAAVHAAAAQQGRAPAKGDARRRR